MRESDILGLNALRGKYKGGRAYVLGSGTSLTRLPRDVLAALPSTGVTIGANFLMRWEGLPFTPNYYCATEEDWFTDISDLAAAKCPDAIKVFAKNHPPHAFRRYNDWICVHREHERLGIVNPEAPAFTGFSSLTGTVIGDCCLQLTAWMGFSQVVLLGVDGDRRGHADGTANEWRFNPPERLVREIAMAREIMSKRGVELVNGARDGDGELTIPRIDLAELVKRVG